MFSVSNNSKWANFFLAIEDHGGLNMGGEIKFIDEKNLYPFNFDTGVAHTKTHTKNQSLQGPVKFSDIEYIFIPTYKEIKRVNRSENLTSKFI